MFEGLIVQDVSHLTAEELISFCSTFQEKTFLNNFLKEYLVDHIAVSTSSDPTNSCATGTEHDRVSYESKDLIFNTEPVVINAVASRFKPVSGILNFSGIVRGESTVTDYSKVTIQSIENRIKAAHEESQPDVITLDLSNNYLTSPDVPYIYRLAEYTHCQVLKVRSNYIQKDNDSDDLYSWFTQIINLPSTVYFDITFNPCASIDSIRYFQTLNESQFKKLIFIPYNWVYTHAWKSMISTKYHPIVIATHGSYYNSVANPMFSSHISK